MSKKIVKPSIPETPVEERKVALKVLASGAKFDPKTYEFDGSFRSGDPDDFRSIHTVPEIMECINKNPEIEASGIFLEADSKGNYRYKKLSNKAQIKEAWTRNSRQRKFREADTFACDGGSNAGANAGLVGDDYIPLLGGPYNKQAYLYDYLRAHSFCFHEYHHNPFARAIVHITRDFVLGRGYRIDCDDPKALALWKAYEKVNKLDEMMEDLVKEGSIYGENMIWWIPDMRVSISYQVPEEQLPQQGLIPRIRMLDPSTCWEIVTFPEDIKRVLYYQFVFPTQYQIYTGESNGKMVPSSKFIMQQIPAGDLMHFKYNCVSNEKRGRSDLFPILGYLKWVRDCVNYRLISLKKQAAWTEDVSVDGSQQDVDAITDAFKSMGEFEPAGSRFVHTNRIVRNYLAPTIQTGGQGDTLLDGVNMIAIGVQIPVTYFGMSHQQGQSRAGALVGTEPVAKKFERRQNEVSRVIQSIWRKFQDEYGVKGSECKITFPEIITQDRSAKMKDLKFAEDSLWISRERAAQMAANELEISDEYDYDKESAQIMAENPEPVMPTLMNPLTAPGAASPGSGTQAPQKPSAVTQDERSDIKKQGSNL